MKPLSLLIVALLALLMSTAAFADSNVTFNNSDGTFFTSVSGGQEVLNLSGSALSGVSNLPAGFNCPPPACMGTVSLMTGALTTGFASLTANTGSAMFASGGSFDVTSTRPGGGFTFQGAFSSESWTKSFVTINGKQQPYWTFVGSIAGGELMVNGQDYMNIGAGTIDLTTVGDHAKSIAGGQLEWTDNSGSTNFPSPVPEPGTLALFGSGLITVGMLTRRKIARR